MEYKRKMTKFTLNQLKRKGSILVTHPEISAEWDVNNKYGPHEYTSGSDEKVIWRCSRCNHQWPATIANRCINLSGCPLCSLYRVSKLQLRVYHLIKNVITDAKLNQKPLIDLQKVKDSDKNLEADIFSKSISLALEIDGFRSHQDYSKDIHKNKAFSDKEIDIIRIRCFPLERLSENDILVDSNQSIGEWFPILLDTISKLKDIHFEESNLNITKTDDELLNEFLTERSLLTCYPEVAEEYDPENDIPVNLIPASSNKMVKWIGKCGHKWGDMKVCSRTGKKQQGCPYCAGKRVLPEESLLGLYPEIVKLFWDYDKNNEIGIYPDKVSPYSGQKAHWKCPANTKHTSHISISAKMSNLWSLSKYKVTIGDADFYFGCKDCFNLRRKTNSFKVALAKTKKDIYRNSIHPEETLAYLYPQLAWQMDVSEKNDLKSSEVKPGEDLLVFFICPVCKVEKPSLIRSKVNSGGACSICEKKSRKSKPARRKITAEESFANNVSDFILNQWDPKNEFSPLDVTPNSGKRATFICQCGHERIREIKSFIKCGGYCKECGTKEAK